MLTLFQIIPTVNIHHRKLKQMPSHRLRLNKVNFNDICRPQSPEPQSISDGLITITNKTMNSLINRNSICPNIPNTTVMLMTNAKHSIKTLLFPACYSFKILWSAAQKWRGKHIITLQQQTALCNYNDYHINHTLLALWKTLSKLSKTNNNKSIKIIWSYIKQQIKIFNCLCTFTEIHKVNVTKTS